MCWRDGGGARWDAGWFLMTGLSYGDSFNSASPKGVGGSGLLMALLPGTGGKGRKFLASMLSETKKKMFVKC